MTDRISNADPDGDRGAGVRGAGTEWDPARCRPAAAGRWQVRWVAETGSTNADLVVAAAAGAPDRAVLLAGLQTAGRGRRGRRWAAPAGAALTFSVLLRPSGVPAERRGWIGALLAMAIVAAVRRRAGLAAELKWPNDVLVGDRKLAGVLAEVAGPAVVVGAGINVGSVPAGLAGVTSLRLAGAAPSGCDREELLAAVLDEFAPLIDRWQAVAGDVDEAGLRAEYLARCATIGQRVTVHLPDGIRVTGTAVDVTGAGTIVIEADGRRRRRFAAGDVEHLRRG